MSYIIDGGASSSLLLSLFQRFFDWGIIALRYILILYSAKVGVDWIKHIFITKFNRLPSYYKLFSHQAARDILLSTYQPQHPYSHSAQRRYGILFMPFILLFYRAIIMILCVLPWLNPTVFAVSISSGCKLFLFITSLLFFYSISYVLHIGLVAYSSNIVLRWNKGFYNTYNNLIIRKDDVIDSELGFEHLGVD